MQTFGLNLFGGGTGGFISFNLDVMLEMNGTDIQVELDDNLQVELEYTQSTAIPLCLDGREFEIEVQT